MKNFVISEYVDALPFAPKNEFRQKIEGMEVGKAINVSGMTKGNAYSRASTIGKTSHPIKKFRAIALENGDTQIQRVS